MSADPSPDEDRRIAGLLDGFLRRTHLSSPSDLAGVVADQAATIGARDVVVYVVNYEQDVLVPVGGDGDSGLEPLSLAGTVAGRAYTSSAVLRTPAEAGFERVWLPLLDGTERLGVLAMTFAHEDLTDAILDGCEGYSHLVALLLTTKGQYGDVFERVRRRKPMTIASELLWALVPPLVFATDDVVLAGLLEPAYDNGGDALDYAVNGRVLHLGVFDAMGHGLAAAGVAAFALSAYRHSRRAGSGLLETYAAMDEAVGRQFPDSRFVTAVIAELELDTGSLAWISAGHPPPVVLRGGRHARTLEAAAAPPLGVAYSRPAPAIAQESLEPGDLLLVYTDGLTEARDRDGEMLTLEGVTRFIEREAAGGQMAPETLRRIRHAILGRERADLRDDATALLVEWRRGTEASVLPDSVA